ASSPRASSYCFLFMIPPPPSSTLFPYTTLFRSLLPRGDLDDPEPVEQLLRLAVGTVGDQRLLGAEVDDESLSRVGEPLAGQQHRSEEHTSELQSRENLVCRLLLEKKNKTNQTPT